MIDSAYACVDKDGHNCILFVDTISHVAFRADESVMRLTPPHGNIAFDGVYAQSIDFKEFSDCKSVDDFVKLTGKNNVVSFVAVSFLLAEYEQTDDFVPHFEIENWDVTFRFYCYDLTTTYPPVNVTFTGGDVDAAIRSLIKMNIPYLMDNPADWHLYDVFVTSHGTMF